MTSMAFFICIFSTLRSLKQIGLISDTHGYLDENVFKHFENCDEIWHAGDFGPIEIASRLNSFKPLRGVFGNIDGSDIKREFPLRVFVAPNDAPISQVDHQNFIGERAIER